MLRLLSVPVLIYKFTTTNNSVIENSSGNTGDFYIQNTVNDKDVIIKTDNSVGGTDDYFRADGSTGEVILYHYGDEKIATKSTGIDVTGNITVSGTVDGRDVAADGACRWLLVTRSTW